LDTAICAQGFGWPSPFQQMCWSVGLNDARAALGTRVFRADRDDHLVASLPPPVRKLMRNNVMTTRNINNPCTRLEAFRHNPSLQIIGPAPVSTARLDNLQPPNKSVTIRRAKSPALAGAVLARTSMLRNIPIQWDGDGAYGDPVTAAGSTSCVDIPTWPHRLLLFMLGYSTSEGFPCAVPGMPPPKTLFDRDPIRRVDHIGGNNRVAGPL
jgi:hypothetical protein